MKRFVLRTGILTISLLLLFSAIYGFWFPDYYSPILLFAIVFFFAVTNGVHFYLLRILEKKIQKFNTRYMMTNFIKIVIYLTFAVVYVLFDRKIVKVFLLNYLLIYILFSIIEVYEISKIVKRKK